ncbi:MAG: ribosome small subunit-dependent GTPase A [Cryomorphaceae bacterium]|jgi:ribosome biogenesis GTPase|nr:ribosome small subunit-dependent GTPase A [Cryomorphaceae bacterium]MBT5416792.1 ribosome small subunit-dependent GTPase A [Cryomorphaceae bacterium]
MTQGTVYKSTGSWYLVKARDNFLECRIKGKIRLKDISTTNPIAVGDHVIFELENDGNGIISDILPRTNYIIRKSVNLSKQRHIIASNIDISVLVVTLNNPTTSKNFIDRFLVSCQAYDIPVIIAFNKVDIYTEEEKSELEKLIKIYKNIGYSCELISAKYGKGINELINLMKNKTCIISGHSGVGKSTLVNSISPNLRLKTKEISSSHNQGKHTTTYAEMFDLDSNIRVIDTPGIRGFGLVDISKFELGDFFPEFFSAKQKCKFNNCLHLDEPDCNVKKKIKEGEIYESRYHTYLDMLKDQNIYRKSDESSDTES